MNIDIIVIGDVKEKYLRDAIKEYEKRLKPYANISTFELKESKLSNNPSPKDIEQALEAEGAEILSKINQRAYVFALCIEGKQLSSEELSESISNLNIEGYNDIAFIIGGSDGLSKAVKDRANFKLSFSKMTFPHQLMRVILLEQIYRAFRIMRNEPYHK